MTEDFHGFELLLLKRFQKDSRLCQEWLKRLDNKLSDDSYELGVSFSVSNKHRRNTIGYDTFPVNNFFVSITSLE